MLLRFPCLQLPPTDIMKRESFVFRAATNAHFHLRECVRLSDRRGMLPLTQTSLATTSLADGGRAY
jgi:hypothetical protein